jgi:tetratricopeptide (TPR) repeat protein
MPTLHFARSGWLAIVLLLSASSSAFAGSSESEDLSKARAKFMQATELEQAGNYAGALQAFREVAQVRMTPQVRYHIALCEEKLGKLVAALGGYELALAEAEALGPEFQKEVEDRASSLRARIPKLVIDRGEGAQAATIELDGVSLGASSIGVEVPIDPGPHDITAKAPGYKGYNTTVDVAEKQVERVSISLEKLPMDENVATGTTSSGQPITSEPTKHSRVIPYVIGGVGAAALVNSGIFYVLQRKKDAELLDLCGNDHVCDPKTDNITQGDVDRALKMNQRMRLYATITQVSLVAGVVALGTAGVLILTEPKAPKPAPSARWFFAPEAPGANLAGVSVNAAF